MPQRNVIIIFLSALISLACYHKARYNRYAATLTDAMGQIVDRYVEPIEERELFEGAMEGMVGQLDQYSGYVSPKGLRQLHEMILDQQFGGVGIEVLLDPKTKRLTVLSPLYGTPAFNAGMHAGDVILEIDGHSTEGISLDEAVQLMRGKPDTEVRLQVLSLGAKTPRLLAIPRAVIGVESVVGDVRGPDGRWRFYLEQDPRIGYIQLTTFGDKTAEELAQTLGDMGRSVEGLILDLRGNAGGLLEVAATVSDLFIDHGEIVTTRDRNGRVERRFSASPKTTLCRLPMAVLVDRYSASSSEIVAACLQDHHRARIIGERTWGKGTVQNVIFLEGGRSAIKLTTATYWRPSHKNIHRGSKAKDSDDWGVRPDKGFEVTLNDEQYAELVTALRQRQLERATRGSAETETAQPQPPPPDKDGKAAKPPESKTDATTVDDPFMDKATKYLDSQISAAARAAA